jgi:hypothetical protein
VSTFARTNDGDGVTPGRGRDSESGENGRRIAGAGPPREYGRRKCMDVDDAGEKGRECECTDDNNVHVAGEKGLEDIDCPGAPGAEILLLINGPGDDIDIDIEDDDEDSGFINSLSKVFIVVFPILSSSFMLMIENSTDSSSTFICGYANKPLSPQRGRWGEVNL